MSNAGRTDSRITILDMAGDPGDLWDQFVAAMLAVGPAEECRSRYGDKPALVVLGREIAHLEARGIVDLRITRAGWTRARERYGNDPAVRRDASRRDWIELHMSTAADLARLDGLLAIAIECNR